mgnify:CR=1 FL=1
MKKIIFNLDQKNLFNSYYKPLISIKETIEEIEEREEMGNDSRYHLEHLYNSYKKIKLNEQKDDKLELKKENKTEAFKGYII